MFEIMIFRTLEQTIILYIITVQIKEENIKRRWNQAIR